MSGAVERAVRRELRALTSEARGSGLAQTVLELAKHMDSALLPARDAAMVARELRIALAELRKMSPTVVRSKVDEVRARREARKRAAGGPAS